MRNRICFYLLVSTLSWVSICLSGQERNDKKMHLPEYYWSNVRTMFKNDQWENGKTLLEQGMKYHPYASPLNELMGQYYYHFKEYDKARYYLIHALKEDNENVMAKQLLVNVEEETGNYSSAICYVNELLEVNPYWQGLWRRKILLYRKQGNNVEADRLLKRINQIYPNDTLLRRDYIYSLEENYQKNRYNNKDKAIASLKELIEKDPMNEKHYLALTNLLLQQGAMEEALQVAGKGANSLNSIPLIQKRAGILAEQGRYTEAMSYVRDCMKALRTASLSTLYNELQLESARSESQQDPYILYGKVYEQRKSEEALNYLLNTAIAREYNEDALYYISEAKKRNLGNNKNKLLYQEYIILNRMGEKLKAENILSKIYENNPNDYDITSKMIHSRLNLADESMKMGEYAEALNYLEFVAQNAQDRETQEVALRKIYNCYYAQRKYKKALATLDVINELYPMPTTQDLLKRVNTLEKMGMEPEALAILKSVLDTCSTQNRALHLEAYEESALPYIKQLQEKGARQAAYREVEKLLELNPASDQALRYAINLAAQQKDYEAFNRYVMLGRTHYPSEHFFLIKQAESYGRNKNYQAALELLQPVLEEYPDNTSLLGAYSENSESRTLQLLKAHEEDQALSTINKALFYDEKNNSLLYTKGLVFEAKHEYDSAHYYQKFYQPALLEVQDVVRHLNSLLNRGYQNEVGINYMRSRYGDQDIITSVASLIYKYHATRSIYGIQANYAGRDGDADKSTSEYQIAGGMGVQLLPSWEYSLSPRWSTFVNAGWANKYFPKWTVNGQLTWHLPKDWDIDFSLGYRYINTYKKEFRWFEANEDPYNIEPHWSFSQWDAQKHNMFSLGIAGSKTLEKFWLNSKLQGNLLTDKFYINWSGQARYFPLQDGVSYVNALVSIGTAPEASIIDNALPGSFSKLNTLVGLSGQYLLTRNLSLGVLGTWSTYYNQMNFRTGTITEPIEWVETNYKNLYSIHVQLYIRF